MAGTGGALPNWHWYDGPAPPPKAWPIRVTAVPPAKGDDEGTTDEIIQWAACKWGIDTDVVRAQAVVGMRVSSSIPQRIWLAR
jgi:hypothetical protein